MSKLAIPSKALGPAGVAWAAAAWLFAAAVQAAPGDAAATPPAAPVKDAIPQEAINVIMCGSLANPSGPFDYRDPVNRGQITLINANHFNADVQNLVRGQTNDLVLADLDFILRTFPNHYPALQTVSRYFLEGGKRYKFRTAECYFDRAMRFVPEDSTVRVLYGIYLLKSGKTNDSLDQLMRALDLSPDSAEIQYDIGLVYFDLKDYRRANEYAARAYAGGYPLPGLQHKLERIGEWNPPPVTEQPTPAAATGTAPETKPAADPKQ